MKTKTILSMLLGVMLLATATAIYAGECTDINLSGMQNPNDLVYTVVGNSSDTIGMNITSNNSIAKVCFDIKYQSDNFTIVFMDKIEKEVIKEVTIYHGGGGTRTIYVDKNITEYIEVPVDKIVYINKTIDCEKNRTEQPIEEKEGFFEKIWNWIKSLFKREVKQK